MPAIGPGVLEIFPVNFAIVASNLNFVSTIELPALKELIPLLQCRQITNHGGGVCLQFDEWQDMIGG